MLKLQKLLISTLLLSLAACAKSPGPSHSFSPSSEPTYCSSATSYSPSITVQGTAQFKSRILVASGGSEGLKGGTAAKPIRFAEVQVLNSSGTVIQCGETDINGAVSIGIPKAAGTYTLKVLSRADNNNYKVSVLNNTTANTPYSTSVQFTVTGSESSAVAVTIPLAAHNGDVLGGAFNILDQVYLANLYLKNNTSCSGCTTFTVAPKANIYWTPGLSPGSYYGSPNTAISFFAKSDDYGSGILRGIYLMGGMNGDVNCTDTDHFDDSVILHEYGHFLENVYSGSDSPGGSHDGNRLVDARLAWSEGWANFIQSAIRSNTHYTDTVGNVDCSGSHFLGVNMNLQTAQTGQDQMGVGTPAGQGIFREVSVSRALFDIYAISGVGFEKVWNVFSGGMYGNSVVFRNMGLFNSLMRTSLTGNTTPLNAFNDVIASTTGKEYQDPGGDLTREYAYTVTPQVGATCTFNINGVLTTAGGVTNFLENEDFFQYYYNGNTANAVITLRYSGSGGTPDDLDLYVYNKTHSYGNTSTMAARSARLYPSSESGVEIVDLTGKSAGYYMINVSADADNLGSGSNTTYYLETNSGASRLCH